VRFIKREIMKRRMTSRTKLLQKFRESGRACEQSRFAALYGKAVDRK
jgi:hypothetical protein